MQRAFVDNAKIVAKGQVTIPKDVRTALGVSNGDRVTFVVEGNVVRLVNSAVYAMQMLQSQMKDAAAVSDLATDDDVVAMIEEMRAESGEK